MCDSGSGDCGFMGGAGGPSYNNGFNTVGMGDVVIPGMNGFGSGDNLCPNNKRKKINGIATKKAPKTFFNGGFVDQPKGGFGQGDLPLIVPSSPKKK